MSAHEFEGSGPDPGQLDPDLLEHGARRELISAYLDGELPAEQARRVSTWLDAHPESLREVEHLRRTWDLLEAYEDETVPEDFAPAVVRAVGIRHARKSGRRLELAWPRKPNVFRAAMAVAAVCLVAVGAFALFSGGPGQTPVVDPTDAAHVAVLESVPPEFLEDMDLLAEIAAFDDEEFEQFLEPEEDTEDETLGG